MRLILSIVLSLFLVGCFSQDVEKVGADVVNSLNTGDYDKLWDKYVDKETKAEFAGDIEEVKASPMVGTLMMSMVGVPDDKMTKITAKEYFGYIMNFFMSMGDLEPGGERLVLVYKGVELIDDDNANILLDNNSVIDTLDLVRIDKKWYFSMEEEAEEAVDVDETIETIEEIDVPVDNK